MKELNQITEAIIGAAIEVHRALGPGLLEASYGAALCIEFENRQMTYLRQHSIPLSYKGRSIGEYRLDFLVEDAVIVEVKSVERLDPIFVFQVLTYLKATSKKLGLLINFNTRFLKDSVKRYIL
jgi:GxxExxY protein